MLSCLEFSLGRSVMQVTMALAITLLLLGAGHTAHAQSLSINPSAAASEVRNPSSINPAAAASDVRNPSATNPSARASQISGPSAISQTRPAGVAPAAPRQRAAPTPRQTSPEKAVEPASNKRDFNLRPLLLQHLLRRRAVPVKRPDLVMTNSSNNGTRLRGGR